MEKILEKCKMGSDNWCQQMANAGGVCVCGGRGGGGGAILERKACMGLQVGQRGRPLCFRE